MHGANYRDGRGQVFTRKEYIKGKPQIKIGADMCDFSYLISITFEQD